MSINAVEFIAPGINLQQLTYGTTANVTGSFESWMVNSLGELNSKLTNSDTAAMRLATGDTSNLHQIMINMEEAKLAFQLAIQVRNRILDAYQEVARMQI